jgi:hypothetical protein
MCVFEYKLLLCGCESASCPQRTKNTIEDNLPEPGHIIRITQVYRISGICMGWHINEDPNRLVVRWGYPADKGNGKQDCSENYVYTFNSNFERGHFCPACLRTCEQPASVARLIASTEPGAREERIRRGLERRWKSDDDDAEAWKEFRIGKIKGRIMKQVLNDYTEGKREESSLPKDVLERIANELFEMED